MKHGSLRIVLPTTAAILMLCMSPTPSSAEGQNVRAIGSAVITLVRKAGGWVRILDDGALVVLTIEEARALHLSPTETAGRVVTVLADDYWDTIKGIGSAGRYIGADVIVPATTTTYRYAVDTVLPAATDAIGSAYQTGKPLAEGAYGYTRHTILPTAGTMATDAYAASKPAVADALARTGGYVTGAGRGLRRFLGGD